MTLSIRLNFEPYPLPSKDIETKSDPVSMAFKTFCLIDFNSPIFG